MEFSALTVISPIDGRYRRSTHELCRYFSEFALIKYRLLVEVEYFIALCQIPLPQLKDVDPSVFDKLRRSVEFFNEEEAQKIKDTEKVTNHDVKAVEYYLKDILKANGLEAYIEFVHFGLTSQDINNTAIPRSLKDGLADVYLPKMTEVIGLLDSRSKEWKSVAMLARTHGQPASPTRLGKEMAVFVERLGIQLDTMKAVPFSAKFGGATGNFNAHHVAYPQYDWVAFANSFLSDKLGVSRSQTTTQIEHYDNMAALFNAMSRLNIILIDLCRDIWTYVSMDYFKQRIKEGEVGSSAMPHKVNPIDFENAEGNLGIANSIFDHLSSKLPISRLQRDLTDSTVLRMIGVPIGHTMIALNSIARGMNKLVLNESKIKADLEANWAVVAEAIQTVLRRESYPSPYEALKELTRTNSTIDENAIAKFIEGLDVSDEIKSELNLIRPENYTGV